MTISVRRSAGGSRGSRGSTPSSRPRSRASRMARNLRLIESLWRYGIGGNLARFGCNLTRSVYLALDRIVTRQLFTIALVCAMSAAVTVRADTTAKLELPSGVEV